MHLLKYHKILHFSLVSYHIYMNTIWHLKFQHTQLAASYASWKFMLSAGNLPGSGRKGKMSPSGIRHLNRTAEKLLPEAFSMAWWWQELKYQWTLISIRRRVNEARTSCLGTSTHSTLTNKRIRSRLEHGWRISDRHVEFIEWWNRNCFDPWISGMSDVRKARLMTKRTSHHWTFQRDLVQRSSWNFIEWPC